MLCHTEHLPVTHPGWKKFKDYTVTKRNAFFKVLFIYHCYFFTGINYAFDWRLITHPKDYSGEMEGKHSKTLKLSKVQLTAFIFMFHSKQNMQLEV